MPSITGRRLLVLAFAVGLAVVLAAALGHSSESEQRAERVAELGSSTKPLITCDQLEALAQAPLLIPRETDVSLFERSEALERGVVRLDDPLPELKAVEPLTSSGPSVWGFLRGLKDAVGRDRDERVSVRLVVHDCNQ